MRIVEKDSRNRISLGDLARHDRYLVEQDEDGTLRLHPAVILTIEEYNKMKESK